MDGKGGGRFTGLVGWLQPRQIPPEEVRADRALLARHVRAAGRPFRGRGWKVADGGLSRRDEDGAWAQIAIRTGPGADALDVRLTAGALSAYLMQVVNALDPDRPPPPTFVAAHVQILWDFELGFGPAWTTPPLPLALPQPPYAQSGIVLGEATAAPWLAHAFDLLAAELEPLCSDLAIRDRLLRVAGARDFIDLRYAALLTRHLGRLDELEEILERARLARQASMDDLRSMGLEAKDRDRSTRYPQDWSHARFLKFLDAAP